MVKAPDLPPAPHKPDKTTGIAAHDTPPKNGARNVATSKSPKRRFLESSYLLCLLVVAIVYAVFPSTTMVLFWVAWTPIGVRVILGIFLMAKDWWKSLQEARGKTDG